MPGVKLRLEQYNGGTVRQGNRVHGRGNEVRLLQAPGMWTVFQIQEVGESRVRSKGAVRRCKLEALDSEGLAGK